MYERAGASVKRACADVRAAGHALEAEPRGNVSMNMAIPRRTVLTILED